MWVRVDVGVRVGVDVRVAVRVGVGVAVGVCVEVEPMPPALVVTEPLHEDRRAPTPLLLTLWV